MTPEQLEQRQFQVNRWNVESIAKPGPRVRVYSLNPDGTVSVQDRPREEVVGHV